MPNLSIQLSQAQLSLIENLNKAAEEMIKTKFPEEVHVQLNYGDIYETR